MMSATTKTQITHWLSEIDQITQDFQTAFGDLSTKQLNWKPDDDTWSIAQNIDHLIVINETYHPILESLHAGTYKVPFLGKLGFVVNFFGNMILKSVQPENRRKVQTFPIWQPSQSTISNNILDHFTQHQADLKNKIQAAQPFLDKKQVIASPANGSIVYKLSTAFDVIVTHEKRHLLQAQRVKAMM